MPKTIPETWSLTSFHVIVVKAIYEAGKKNIGAEQMADLGLAAQQALRMLFINEAAAKVLDTVKEAGLDPANPTHVVGVWSSIGIAAIDHTEAAAIRFMNIAHAVLGDDKWDVTDVLKKLKEEDQL